MVWNKMVNAKNPDDPEKFQKPTTAEGFQDVVEIDFQFRGTKEQYRVWGRHWHS
jgi:hypothetical protein